LWQGAYAPFFDAYNPHQSKVQKGINIATQIGCQNPHQDLNQFPCIKIN